MPHASVTARQAAESFFAAIPHALTPSELRKYDIDATAEQAQHLTRELLLLNLFWLHSAMHAAWPRSDATQVIEALKDCLRRHWDTALGLNPRDFEPFLSDLDQRRTAYHRIVQAGGSPVDVLTEAAAVLGSTSGIRDEDRPKLLGFLIDIVPIDDLGEMAAEIKIQE